MPRDWNVTGRLRLGRSRRPDVDGSWDIEFTDFPEEDRQDRGVELPVGIFPIKGRVIERDGRLFLAALIVELVPAPQPELEVLQGGDRIDAPRRESREPWPRRR